MRARSFALGTAVLALLLNAVVPLGASEAPVPAPAVPGLDKTTVIAMFRDQALPADLAALGEAHGADIEVLQELGGAIFTAPTEAAGEALLATLLVRADVVAAEHDFSYQLHANPNDPRFALQWGPKAIKLPLAWDLGFGSHAARVAVLDTGADLDHEDLAANICGGKNFLSTNSPPEDDNDHGSHTAGIVGAVANNGAGVAGASQSCLLIGKVCDQDGNCDISKVSAAISWAINPDGNTATDDAAHIVSMSFGGTLPSSSLQTAMNVAWNRGLLLVASAGNDFCGPVGYPAAYDPVIAVASLMVPPIIGVVTGAVTGQTEIRSEFSNCGPSVELAAPGTSILSTTTGNSYQAFSGTSMAAPMVAGVAALVKSANPSLTNAQLRCYLDMTAQDYGAPKRDVEYGFGKVRADLAIGAAIAAQPCTLYQLGIGIGGQNLGVVSTPPL
jgi:subtilisin family serine protease